jgi:F0F1-type ATP synthase assembly protein I
MAERREDHLERTTKNSSSPSDNVIEGEKSQTSTDRNVGWIDSLAQRSTGLPGTSRATKTESDEKSPWRYAGLGLQFAGTTLIFVLMGYQLDKKMGWSPWGLVSLGMLGVIGGLYLLIKEVIKENADEPRPGGGKK